MTRTIRERKSTSVPLHRLYTLFRIHFIPERIKYHSRNNIFNIKRENEETAAEVWKRILDVAEKCEFENIPQQHWYLQNSHHYWENRQETTSGKGKSRKAT